MAKLAEGGASNFTDDGTCSSTLVPNNWRGDEKSAGLQAQSGNRAHLNVEPVPVYP